MERTIGFGAVAVLALLACSPSTKAPPFPDGAPVLRVYPYQLQLVAAVDIEVDCKVGGVPCVPENLDPVLGCGEPLETCGRLWETVTTDLPPRSGQASVIPLRSADELEFDRFYWDFNKVDASHIGVGVGRSVQARVFLSIPHTLAVVDGLLGMTLTQTPYHPNGLVFFYIHTDRREMPLGVGQMWLREAHLALRPDGFQVWTAGSKEPRWIPRAEPTDGWRELVAATRALDRRGYDADTLVIALHPEVRFWVLWRTLALVGLRYDDGAFEGAADIDAVRPQRDGDEPKRRFRRVWLTVEDR